MGAFGSERNRQKMSRSRSTLAKRIDKQKLTAAYSGLHTAKSFVTACWPRVEIRKGDFGNNMYSLCEIEKYFCILYKRRFGSRNHDHTSCRLAAFSAFNPRLFPKTVDLLSIKYLRIEVSWRECIRMETLAFST